MKIISRDISRKGNRYKKMQWRRLLSSLAMGIATLVIAVVVGVLSCSFIADARTGDGYDDLRTGYYNTKQTYPGAFYFNGQTSEIISCYANSKYSNGYSSLVSKNTIPFWGLMVDKNNTETKNYRFPLHYYAGQKVNVSFGGNYYVGLNSNASGNAFGTVNSSGKTLSFDSTVTGYFGSAQNNIYASYSSNVSGTTAQRLAKMPSLYVKDGTTKIYPTVTSSLNTNDRTFYSSFIHYKPISSNWANSEGGGYETWNASDYSYTNVRTYYKVTAANYAGATMGQELQDYYQSQVDALKNSSNVDYFLYARNKMVCYGTDDDYKMFNNCINYCVANKGWTLYNSGQGISISDGQVVQMITVAYDHKSATNVKKRNGESSDYLDEAYLRFTACLYTEYAMNINMSAQLDLPIVSTEGGTQFTQSKMDVSKDTRLVFANNNKVNGATVGTIKYCLTDTKSNNRASLSYTTYTPGTSTAVPVNNKKYLYVYTYETFNAARNSYSSDYEEYQLSYLPSLDRTVVSSPADQSSISLSDTINLTSVGAEKVIYSKGEKPDLVLVPAALRKELLTPIPINSATGVYSDGSNYYLCLNGVVYKSIKSGTKPANVEADLKNTASVPIYEDTSITSTAADFGTENIRTIWALAVKAGEEVSRNADGTASFTSLHYFRKMEVPSVLTETTCMDVSDATKYVAPKDPKTASISKDDLLVLIPSENNKDKDNHQIGTLQYRLSDTVLSAADQNSATGWTAYTTPLSPDSKNFLYVRTEYTTPDTMDGVTLSNTNKYNVGEIRLHYISSSDLQIVSTPKSGSSVDIGGSISLSATGGTDPVIIYKVSPTANLTLERVSNADITTLAMQSVVNNDEKWKGGGLIVVPNENGVSYIRLNKVWYKTSEQIAIFKEDTPIVTTEGMYATGAVVISAMALENGSELGSFETLIFGKALSAPAVTAFSGNSLSALPSDDVLLLTNTNVDVTEGSFQYVLSKTEVIDPSTLSSWMDYDEVNGIVPQGKAYLYVRFIGNVNGVDVISKVGSYELGFLPDSTATVSFDPDPTVGQGNEVSAGDSVAINGSGTSTLYVAVTGGCAEPTLRPLTRTERNSPSLMTLFTTGSGVDLVKDNGTNKVYVRVNNLWYESSDSNLKIYTGGLTIDEEIDTKQFETIWAISMSDGENPGKFTKAEYMIHLDAPLISTESGTDISKPISIDDEILLTYPGNGTLGTLQYFLSDAQVNPKEITGWMDFTGSIISQGKPYLYTRVAYTSGGATVSNDLSNAETALTYLEASTATVKADIESGSSIDVGDQVKIEKTGELTIIGVDLSASPGFTKVSRAKRLSLGLDNLKAAQTKTSDELVSYTADDGSFYIRVNNLWYVATVKGLKVFDGLPVEAGDNLRTTNALIIHVLSINGGEELGNFVTFRYGLGLSEQVAAPTALNNEGNVSADETTTVSFGDRIMLMTATTDASKQMVPIFYTLNGSAPIIKIGEKGPEAGENTYLYTGEIKVEESLAGYGQTFTIMAQAVYYEQVNGEWYRVLKDSNVARFTFKVQDQASVAPITSAPTTTDAEPAVVNVGSQVQLFTETEGAAIFYTTDGTEPSYKVTTDENGQEVLTPKKSTKRYTGGIPVPEANGETMFTITAIAYKANLQPSPIARMTFKYPNSVSAPYATPVEGAVTENTIVTLASATEGAVIYYEVAYDNATPNTPTTESNVYDDTNPFRILKKTTISAIAVKDGMVSSVSTFHYEVAEKLSPPTPSIENGSVVPAGTVVTFTGPADASINYTIDGSDPKAADNKAVMIGNNAILTGDPGAVILIRAYCSKTGCTPSDPVTLTYIISSYAGGVYADKESESVLKSGDVVHLGTDVSGATIHYTTDGSTPTTTSASGTAVTVSGEPGSKFTIIAFAVVGGSGKSTNYGTFTYTIMDQLAAPLASVPNGAIFTQESSVTLSAEKGEIHYTTDGTEPSGASMIYKKAIPITEAVTIKAISIDSEYQDSDVVTFSYEFASQVAMPVADLESGEVEIGTEITFTTETDGATIYYRTDGKEPDPDDESTTYKYTGPVAINKATNFKVVAVKRHMQDSEVLRIGFTVKEIEIVEEVEEEEEPQDYASTGRLQSRRSYSEGSEGPSYSDVTMKNAIYGVILTGEEESVADAVVLNVEIKQASEADERIVQQRLGNSYDIITGYRIYLTVNGGESEPLKPIEIGIPIPDEYQNSVMELVRIYDDGTVGVLEGRRSGNMVYCITSELGQFGLVAPVNFQEDKGELNFRLVMFLVVSGFIVFGGVLIYLARKVRMGKEDE